MKLYCALLILLLGAVSSAQEQPSSSASSGTPSSAPHPAKVHQISRTLDYASCQTFALALNYFMYYFALLLPEDNYGDAA